MSDHDIDKIAQGVRRASRILIGLFILFLIGFTFNFWKTQQVQKHAAEDTRAALIVGCERGNDRAREQNRRLPGERVELDASIVVAGLSGKAFQALQLPPTPEYLRLNSLSPNHIRLIRGSLEELPVVDCPAQYPAP